MATLDIEDRKRPLDPELRADAASASKRPHLERSMSSFVSNGSYTVKQDDDDGEGENIPAYKGLEVSHVCFMPPLLLVLTSFDICRLFVRKPSSAK